MTSGAAPLLTALLEAGGTELHLAANEPPLARVRGAFVSLRGAPIAARELEEILLELLTPAQRAQLATELELDFAFVHGAARFRARCFAKHGGVAAKLRALPERAPSLEEVGCPAALSALRAGLVLVAGPRASGKSATVAALIDHANRTRPCHIVTIERPIEIVHEPVRALVTQREVGAHAPSFAAALDGALREAPDVVYVSDLPGAEEIEAALLLAASGALVLASVPARRAADALYKLTRAFDAEDAERARDLLAECLAGVVVQHLVPSAEGERRLPFHEILLATPEVAARVRAGQWDDLEELMDPRDGMQTLGAALERGVREGQVSRSAALERSPDEETSARLLSC